MTQKISREICNKDACKIEFENIKDKLKILDKRVEDLGNIDKTLVEFNMAIKYIREDGTRREQLIEQQSTLLERLSQAIIQVNQNLQNLNYEIKDTREGMENVQTEVTHLKKRVDSNEKKQIIKEKELLEKQSINIIDTAKKGIVYALSIGIAGGVMGLVFLYVSKLLGLQ